MRVKAKKRQDGTGADVKCTGGRSFMCQRDPHDHGKIPNITCYRCGVRLGCSVCTGSSYELICLECHNWGHRAGVAQHGNVAPNIKQPRVRTDAGWRTWSAERGERDVTAEADGLIHRVADGN